ncbi:hypothetical protein IscW_ISCW001522 [Ixodes scapularis]|uniref:Uncharacterized protein n=1 Tax=Ixodes scapularis TaxID=6945 RepID=B7P2P1_IXOSC|nr:hypothetical protein IscW_ISCW001522 [Ixodes scapularis]|eukprot:XP_002402671.1 hypothetical protein IscW_ISCW001522 [Ixodes scapularis]
MITSIKPAGTEVFMGLVARSSIASSVTAMNILKTLMSTVRANIVILETHAFKDADCIGNPYISWTAPGTSPFGDPSVKDAKMVLKGRYRLGWALFGIEYTQQDAEACGPPYPRIRAVKAALSGTSQVTDWYQ